jgi:hypothetical protein
VRKGWTDAAEGNIILIIPLTKEPSVTTSEGRDRPDVEITEEMIRAGLKTLLEHCPDTACGDAPDRALVIDLFRVMRALEQNQ